MINLSRHGYRQSENFPLDVYSLGWQESCGQTEGKNEVVRTEME